MSAAPWRSGAMLAVLQARQVARAHGYALSNLALGQLLGAAQRADTGTEGMGTFSLGFRAADGHTRRSTPALQSIP